MIKIIGIAGSIRIGSYNKALLINAQKLMPPESELEIFDLKDIPLFNQDLEHDLPPSVKALKHAVKSADGVLISTPEYNYSFSGVLKNALDWITRPSEDNSISGKIVAIMSVSVGRFGGIRAQYHLRQVLTGLNTYTLTNPEIFVTFADKKFDEQRNLTDAQAVELLKSLLNNMVMAARTRSISLITPTS
ncbi:MAG: NADPH-dependent FMN reductase [Thermoplasmata archaeon]